MLEEFRGPLDKLTNGRNNIFKISNAVVMKRKAAWEEFYQVMSSIPDDVPGINLDDELQISREQNDCDHGNCDIDEDIASDAVDSDEDSGHGDDDENSDYLTSLSNSCDPIPEELKEILKTKHVMEFFDAYQHINFECYDWLMNLYISNFPEVIEAEDIVFMYSRYNRWQVMVYCLLSDRKLSSQNRKYHNYLKEFLQMLDNKIQKRGLLKSHIKFITYEYRVIHMLINS